MKRVVILTALVLATGAALPVIASAQFPHHGMPHHGHVVQSNVLFQQRQYAMYQQALLYQQWMLAQQQRMMMQHAYRTQQQPPWQPMIYAPMFQGNLPAMPMDPATRKALLELNKQARKMMSAGI